VERAESIFVCLVIAEVGNWGMNLEFGQNGPHRVALIPVSHTEFNTAVELLHVETGTIRYR
jgi:hypothetical protein